MGCSACGRNMAKTTIVYPTQLPMSPLPGSTKPYVAGYKLKRPTVQPQPLSGVVTPELEVKRDPSTGQPISVIKTGNQPVVEKESKEEKY